MRDKRKLTASVIAGGMAVAILLTGTFAWQSISQTGKNEMMGDPNPGGRLHDDFDGENKDIYVENFTDPKDGTPIFARIRLYEYMEVGEGAGDPNAQGRGTDIKVIGKTNAKFDDPATWAIHYLDQDDAMATTDHLTFHDYVTWDQEGGSTVYMPTFNKNKDSLLIDQNGTLEGPDSVRPGQQGDGLDAYQDYRTYTVGQQATGNAIYDADDDTADEVGAYLTPDTVDGGYQVVVPPEAQVGGPVLGTDYTLNKETHKAQQTEDCTVITMAEWKDMPDEEKVGNYWVYDTDGWAYWAAPIMPGTATGLLLDGVHMNQPDEEWYYAIDVVAQFSTANDWGTVDGGEDGKGDGFFAEANGGMQEDGESVLDMAAESLNNKLTISLNNTVEDIATVDSFVAQPGDKARFSVTATINGKTQQLNMTELENVEWTISGNNAGASSVQSPYKYSSTDFGNSYNCDDDSALLTLDEAVPAGTNLTVTAEYEGLTDQVVVQVKELAYENLDEVIPGSLTTVTIDSYEWYVLVKDGERVLLWSEDSVGTSEFATSLTDWTWENSNARNYLRITFWDKLVTLKQTGVVEPTTLASWDGKGYSAANWKSTQDTVFLLTEADLFGYASEYDYETQNALNRRSVTLADYTYSVDGQGQIVAPDVEMRKYSTTIYGDNSDKFSALRHVSGGDLIQGSGYQSGLMTGQYYTGTVGRVINAPNIRALRPAMWVNLGVNITP